MTITFNMACPSPGHWVHDLDLPDNVVTDIRRSPNGNFRRRGTCQFCQSRIFSDHITSHMTRDIRFGAWYNEDFTITEWP